MPLKLFKRPGSPYFYMRGTVRGQSVYESTETTDKNAAEEIRVKREGEVLTESIWGKAKVVTFAHALTDYVENGGDKRFLEPLLKHFKTTLLRDIGQHAIDEAAKKLYPKAAPATRNRQVYSPVSAILYHSARKGWCDRPILARPKQPKGVVRWIKHDEAERLIEACAPHLKPLVIFLLNTGARAGEAVWLTWSAVDLDRGQVTFAKTKNGEARSVPLNSRVVAALTALKHRDGAVFLTHKGEPYSRPKREDDTSAGTRIGTAFAAACERAGIKDFTPHCCRHTWATWHYQANRDFTSLMALGGWKTVSMVTRYAHTDVGNHAQGMENLVGAKPVQPKSKTA